MRGLLPMLNVHFLRLEKNANKGCLQCQQIQRDNSKKQISNNTGRLKHTAVHATNLQNWHQRRLWCCFVVFNGLQLRWRELCTRAEAVGQGPDSVGPSQGFPLFFLGRWEYKKTFSEGHYVIKVTSEMDLPPMFTMEAAVWNNVEWIKWTKKNENITRAKKYWKDT